MAAEGIPITPEEQAQKDTTTMERLVALRLLRENMFYADPTRYAMTDIAEDLPGPARSVGAFLKNVLPSKAIISEDPNKRKLQIDAAIERIKSSKKSKEDLGKEIVKNVKELGLGSLLPGFLLGGAFHLLGPRWIRGNKLLTKTLVPGAKPIKETLTTRVWRSPITPIKNISNLFNKKDYAKLVLKKSIGDSLLGAGMSAATGAAYPILAYNTQISDKALQEARRVMEEQPYITSLPTSEILSVIKQQKPEAVDENTQTLKNIGLGTGIGAATGVVGGMLPLAFQAAMLPFSKKPNAFRQLFSKSLAEARNNAIFGGLLGGASGAVTKNLIADEYENIKNQVAQHDQEKEQNANQTANTYTPEPGRVVL